MLAVSIQVAVRQALLGPAVGRKERNNRALANERRRSGMQIHRGGKHGAGRVSQPLKQAGQTG